MLASAVGNSSHSSFVFRGFPALRRHRRLLALPLAASYLTVLLGNGALLHAIRRSPRLRAPMHLLLAALCAVDVLSATAVAPGLLLGLVFGRDRISLAGCLAQMFCTHFLSSLESTLLLAMALDRYAAVCRPLRYAELVDASAAAKLLLFALLRSGAVMAALVGSAGSLRFCGSDVIRHCYCDHMALVGLACGGTRRSRAAGLAVIVCVVGVDIPLICLSYLRILAAVFRAAGGEERRKALHTCGTHLTVMLSFYLVGSLSFLSNNLDLRIPTDANSLMGLVYILLPATVNPVVYGVRTTEIRNVLLTVLRVRGRKRTSIKVPPAGETQT